MLGCILALSNLQFINLGVKYYDAVDVVPVLNAATLIAEILSGLIVGGEYKDYNAFTLFLIFVSSVICISGIQVLVMKSSQLDLEKPDGCDDIRSVRSMSIASRSEGGKRLPIYNRTQIVGKLVKIFTEKHEDGDLEKDSPKPKMKVKVTETDNFQKELLLNNTKNPQTPLTSAEQSNRNTTETNDEIIEEH